MNTAADSANTEYNKFLDRLVQDALEAAREMDILPEEALNNILECIGDDASIKLEQVTENSNQ